MLASKRGHSRWLAFFLLSGLCMMAVSSSVLTQSGGPYVIEKSVIAGGGAASGGGQYTLTGTMGQSVAGQRALSGPTSEHAGFWSADPLVTTAALVTLSGRVTTADGRGIRNVRIIMHGPSGESHSAITGPFGYFRFDDVQVGGAYIFTLSARRYTFQQSEIFRTILDSVNDLDFTAIGN